MKIGFIGVGNMGSAVVKAVHCIGEHSIYLSNHNLDKVEQLNEQIDRQATILSNEEIATMCDVIFLGVKPNRILELLQQFSSMAKDSCLWVSMSAGITLEQLNGMLNNQSQSIIRMMPNTPIEIGEGMISYTYTKNLSKDKVELFEVLLSQSGTLLYVDEHKMDAATAIAGCGPAFIYQLIEALADAGVREGLTRSEAMLLATQMIQGSAKMVIQTKKHPAQLKDEVTSPGGSTIVGIATLEKNGFRSAIIEAVHAAFETTQSLKSK